MKKLVMMAFAALMMGSMITGCGYVKQGEVGVIVNKWGDDKGIVEEEVGQGYTFLGIRKLLYTFPTYKQNYVWTKNSQEGSENDEAIYFNTNDGLAIDVDIGISYNIVPDMADKLFAEYRMGVEEITDKYLRNMVRDEINSLSEKYTCEDIYGKKKGEFFTMVETNMKKRCLSKGIIVESVYLIGRPRLPSTVNNSIAAKIEATQKAQMRENEVAEAIAQADKDRAQAKGQADAYRSVEMAKIEVMEAQARVLKENPQLLQWKAVETWDGILPKFNGGGAVPFIDVANVK